MLFFGVDFFFKASILTCTHTLILSGVALGVGLGVALLIIAVIMSVVVCVCISRNKNKYEVVKNSLRATKTEDDKDDMRKRTRRGYSGLPSE